MLLDQILFWGFYNGLPHLPVFNVFFTAISSSAYPSLIWLPLVIGFLLYHHRKRGWILLEAVFAMGIGVVFSEFILKEIFARPRPFEVFSNLSSMDPTATGFSFPSSHAVAALSLATVIALSTKNIKIQALMTSYAILVCYSRIYLGVHFPLDVVAGALLGVLLGWLSSQFLPHFYKSLFRKAGYF
ncbi:MAG: hypothetical protein COT24_01830 [Candidatus Kerfeldbacteria bacterium CG08_land_8_20_14_0_20_40_16]|uniref:Phosphatidic acid phosphatase type 2/haloperoxidase domain-containing protein n=1 Tax=Candidatus Kerfeldbacteria bacterium CG08_land_8_20_14_0_20_40_16 TaxID=2014244 RepID=A0A2H0YWU3_9BACT|nr:MAG: hypothetical protein COT24_01830 [Candidatus Kerfeldbacteria bacterium CG08_land_8_20_14_0_20_40_16]